MNKAVGADHSWAIDAANTLTLGASWTRFIEGAGRPLQAQFKPADVGLPAYLDEKAGPYHPYAPSRTCTRHSRPGGRFVFELNMAEAFENAVA